MKTLKVKAQVAKFSINGLSVIELKKGTVFSVGDELGEKLLKLEVVENTKEKADEKLVFVKEEINLNELDEGELNEGDSNEE